MNYFDLMNYLKNKILFRIKSALKEFLKTKIKPHGKNKKNDDYYLQVFLKGCKHVKKKVVGHIYDKLSDFGEFDEE